MPASSMRASTGASGSFQLFVKPQLAAALELNSRFGYEPERRIGGRRRVAGQSETQELRRRILDVGKARVGSSKCAAIIASSENRASSIPAE